MAKGVKITVLKRLVMDDIVAKYAPDGKMSPCHRCNEGDVFVTDGRKVPEGFCVWAWADIFKDVLLVRQEAKCSTADGKCQVVSCTDGFRPVVFLIEPTNDI